MHKFKDPLTIYIDSFNNKLTKKKTEHTITVEYDSEKTVAHYFNIALKEQKRYIARTDKIWEKVFKSVHISKNPEDLDIIQSIVDIKKRKIWLLIMTAEDCKKVMHNFKIISQFDDKEKKEVTSQKIYF